MLRLAKQYAHSHPPSLPGGGLPVCTGPDFPIQQNPESADFSSFSTSILPIVSVKLETNVKYLIHNCEQKGYNDSSYQYQEGNSNVRSSSRYQHTKH
jgi:hypothetical protein